MNRVVWLHCSEIDHGPVFSAVRRRPFVGSLEPGTPRLCVASSVARCFAARFFYPGRPVYVYASKERRAVNPGARLVWDIAVTRERWLIPPVSLSRVAVVPPGVVDDSMAVMMRLLCRRVARGESGVTLVERALGLHEAVRAFASLPSVPGVLWYTKSDLAFCRLFAERFPEMLSGAPGLPGATVPA